MSALVAQQWRAVVLGGTVVLRAKNGYMTFMGKSTKKTGTTLIGRDPKAGRYIVRKGDGRIETWKVSKRSVESIDEARKRYARVLKRLADK